MTTVEKFEEALWAEYNTGIDDPEDWENDWCDVVWSIPEEGWWTPVGLIEVAENHGGGEGSGEVRYIVFKLTNSDLTIQYFRIDGYYLSFEGSSFDGNLKEVKAVVRPVTFFE